MPVSRTNNSILQALLHYQQAMRPPEPMNKGLIDPDLLFQLMHPHVMPYGNQELVDLYGDISPAESLDDNIMATETPGLNKMFMSQGTYSDKL